MSDLAAAGYQLEINGFDLDELSGYLTDTPGRCDPDEVPEVPVEPLSKPGDLWLLGEHRLLCGDATSLDDVKRLIDGRRAALMATDPP